MENTKHYPTHPGAEHPPIMTCEIPLEEYESLKRENEELKAKLESVQATAYTESVDAGMENRRLKRAMWLARGYIMTLLNRDFQRLAYQCNNDDYKKNLLRRRNRYYELSEKCLNKAKEYK